MSIELTPEDDDAKNKIANGKHIKPGQPKSKAKNPWKGRFDRRKTPREEPVDFPDQDTGNAKPDSKE